MNKVLTWLVGWFRSGSGALADGTGVQSGAPSTALIADTTALGPDSAFQIAAVWACVERIAKTVATLPIIVYENGRAGRERATDSPLWGLLHNSPNGRMTPAEFWMAMLLNFILRGNAYARIERSANGEAYALWPMSADQTEMSVLPDGSVVYLYRVGNDVAALDEGNVLHIKEMGNGTIGLARLDYMRGTTTESTHAQYAASRMFGNGGKPTGLLMIDNVLTKDQREAIKANFSEMASGSMSRLFLLEANMKYQQLSLSPEDMQLLTTRQFNIEEIGRWFGVPSVLINHSNVTTWGSGIEQIMDGFYKITLGPILKLIEQALTKRVLTSAQRVRYTVEFNFEGLLRASLKDRMELYAKAVQNGLKTRNECRRLENDPPIEGGDTLTAQTNLAPIDMLGKIAGSGNTATQEPVAQ